MQALHQAMLLKKLYLLRALGFVYSNPIFTKARASNFQAKDINSLDLMIKNCKLCPKKAQNLMPNAGLCNKDSKIVFVSLFPLLDGNLRFSSKSSEMLLKIITNVFHLEVCNVSILSLLKCEIPKSDLQDSLQSCAPFFQKQLEFTQCKNIITLGSEAYFYLTNDGTAFERIKGQLLQWQNRNLFPCFSPLDLLKNPSLKTQAHKDFINIKGYL